MTEKEKLVVIKLMIWKVSISLPISKWCFIYIQAQNQEKITSNIAIAEFNKDMVIFQSLGH